MHTTVGAGKGVGLGFGVTLRLCGPRLTKNELEIGFEAFKLCEAEPCAYLTL